MKKYYLNLDCPNTIRINQRFSLFTQLLPKPVESDASPIQEGIAVDISQLYELEVVLRSKSFDIEGSNTLFIDVSRTMELEARFVLTPRQVGKQQVRVDFYQHEQRVGTVRRDVVVEGQPVSRNFIVSPIEPSPIEILSQPTIPPPDLELRVQLDQRDCTLSFSLHSTKEEINFHHTPCGQVTMGDPPSQKMQRVYEKLNQLAAQPFQDQGEPTVDQRKFSVAKQDDISETASQRLTSVGNELWHELIPQKLKDDYWQFKARVKSLLITSDEPWIPWEMVKPYRNNKGKIEQEPFWCQQFATSRWLSGPGTIDKLPTNKIVPVAPVQSNLASLKEELDFIEKMLSLHPNLSPCTPINRATELREYIKANEFSILHFACHGMFNGTLPNDSSIELSDGLLCPSDMRSYFALQCHHPLVFINACDGGRLDFNFTGLGGWARLFVDVRVGAFIGAMWEVNDRLALEFAQTFYRSLLHDKKTIAEAFRYSREQIRKLAPNNSTWLAYSLYADPEARV